MSTLRRIMLGSGEVDLSKIPESRKVYYEAVEKLTARPFPLIANKYDFNTKEGILVSTQDIITLPYGAFRGQTGLKKITIPSSVTTINSEAFYNCTLDELVLQSPFLETNYTRSVLSYPTRVVHSNYWKDGVKINKLVIKGYPNNEENSKVNIGNYIFAASDIKMVEFDDSLKYTLGEGVFEMSKIEEIVLDPKSFDLEIPKMCFNNCYYLKKITLGERVVKLGYRAFFGGDSLETLIIKTNLSNCEFDSEYFSFCTKNSDTLSLYLYNNTLSEFVSSNLMSSLASFYKTPTYIYINDELLKNVIIPDDVSEIKYSVFKNSIIESVEIPNNVISIYSGAFSNCSKLSSVKIGTGVSNIGEDVFLGVSGEITIDSNIIGNDFSSDNAGNESFLKGSNFTTVNIGNNVNKIGKEAFAYLDLENVILGNSLVEIESNAFYGCDKLSNVNISNSVTTIGDMAFHSCESLTSITIPDNVTTIGKYTFKGCFFTKENFINNSELDEVANDYWGASIYDIIQDDGLCISDNTVYDCKPGSTVVTIPNNITSISRGAFSGCSRLTSITIPNSVTKIGSSAFAGCSSLVSITIPDSVETIGAGAFDDCNNLTEFNGKYASEDSKFLIKDGNILGFAPANTTTCNVPEGVSDLDMTIFIKSLESLTLPSSIVTCKCLGKAISINNLYCKATTPPGLSIISFAVPSFTKIYVPMDSVDAYKAASGWSNYSDKIFGYNF